MYMVKRKILIRKVTVDAVMEGCNKALDERGEKEFWAPLGDLDELRRITVHSLGPSHLKKRGSKDQFLWSLETTSGKRPIHVSTSSGRGKMFKWNVD